MEDVSPQMTLPKYHLFNLNMQETPGNTYQCVGLLD